MRFDCICQKGHRFTFFGTEAPELCDVTRWEAGVGSVEHVNGLGQHVIQNPVPVACGALVEAQLVATVRAFTTSSGSSPGSAPTAEPEPPTGSSGQ